MGAAEVAFAHYRRQKALARRAALRVRRLWAEVDRDNIARSWAAKLPAATTTVASAQLLAAQASDDYVARVLAEQGADADVEGEILAEAFAGTASDGRPLDSLLFRPVVTSLSAIRQGAKPRAAMAVGALHLDLITRTQVADAGRVADSVAIVTRPQVTGYVRLLSPPSCSRCVVLAGRKYRWNEAFLRHPRCDCRHIPEVEDTDDDLRTDPKAYFESLSPEEQDKVFTRAGAQAIRDGSDIARVVNARRGITAASAFGRDLLTTTEGARRGRVRLMPESIYQIAGDDRDEALRLLRVHGYISDRPKPKPEPKPKRVSVFATDPRKASRDYFAEQLAHEEARIAEGRDFIAARDKELREVYGLKGAQLTAAKRRDERLRREKEIIAGAEDRAADLRRQLAEYGPPTHPEIDKLPRKSQPFGDNPNADERSFLLDRDVARTNPGYGQPGYDINCVHVVAAHELRRRGYKVTASALPEYLRLNRGREAQEMVDRWRTLYGGTRKLAGPLTVQGMFEEIETWPEGARGWVRVGWARDLGGGGHIFNVEKIDGEVRFVDAQNSQTRVDINDVASRAVRNPQTGIADGFSLVRVDDLTPTDAVLEFVNER